MSYAPSKKVIIFLAVALFGLIWLFLVTSEGMKGGDLVFDYSGEKSGATKFLKGAGDDFDGDGLMDWEETLWGSNVSDPDTDNDGTSDGDEVRMGRNPIIAGPNDIWVGSPIVGNTSPVIAEDGGETKTSLLSKQLVASYVTLKQSGEVITDPVKQSMAEHFAGSIKEIVGKDKYTLFDIKISKSISTNNSLRTYGNEVGGIIKKYLDDKLPDEAEIMTVLRLVEQQKSESDVLTEEKRNILMEKGSKELVNSLTIFVESYRNAIDNLIKLEVPSDVSKLHLSLINNFNNVMIADENMMKIFSDPLAGIAGIDLYATESGKIFNTLQSLVNYFSNKEITFGENEYGYIFIRLLELK